jgi:hypothetical protein
MIGLVSDLLMEMKQSVYVGMTSSLIHDSFWYGKWEDIKCAICHPFRWHVHYLEMVETDYLVKVVE